MLRDLIEPRSGARFLFFGGKGGVGKSTVSAATAVWLADAGLRVLLVSTDLQRSLSDIFEVDIGHRLASIPRGPRSLVVTETDPRELVRENWHKLAGTVQDVFGPSELMELMSREVSPCAMEMASFYKLMGLLTEDSKERDVIVFDTAPGGRALIEIGLPFAMARRYGRDDPFAEFGPDRSDARMTLLAQSEQETKETLKLLTDPDRTAFIYVLWPESLPIAEAERAMEELAAHQIAVPGIVVNQILPQEEVEKADTPFFWERYRMQQTHLTHVREIFGDKEIGEIPLLPGEARGVARLSEVARHLYGDGRHA